MDERFEIWNVFHDGSITAVEQNGDTVRMFVSIPYLRRRMQPLGDSFVVTLLDVQECEFVHFDGERTSLTHVFLSGEPEILSTTSDAMPLTVHTTLGQLILSFGSLGLALDTGEQVSFERVLAVANQYWEELSRRGAGV